MACFWPLYEEYKMILQGKNCLLNLKRTDSKNIIKVVCNEKNMCIEKELFTLNELYKKFNIVDYGFDEFFVVEIISIKQSYDYMCRSVSNRF